MEVAGEPAIKAVQNIIHAISFTPSDKVLIIKELGIVARVLGELLVIFSRMYEQNDPSVFYNKLRPYASFYA